MWLILHPNDVIMNTFLAGNQVNGCFDFAISVFLVTPNGASIA